MLRLLRFAAHSRYPRSFVGPTTLRRRRLCFRLSGPPSPEGGVVDGGVDVDVERGRAVRTADANFGWFVEFLCWARVQVRPLQTWCQNGVEVFKKLDVKYQILW